MNAKVQVVDVRSLVCPEAALQAKAAMHHAKKGAQIEVWSTDPLAPVDLEVLCHRLGHRLVGHATVDEHVVTTIEIMAS